MNLKDRLEARSSLGLCHKLYNAYHLTVIINRTTIIRLGKYHSFLPKNTTNNGKLERDT